jgi:uncharacterized tellurite resistance protein B-like protein
MAHDIATTILSMAKATEETEDVSTFLMTMDVHLDGEHRIKNYEYSVVKTPAYIKITSGCEPRTKYKLKTGGLGPDHLDAYLTSLWKEMIKLRFQEAYRDDPEVKRAEILVGFKVCDAGGKQHMLEMTHSTFVEVMVEGQFKNFDRLLSTLALASGPYLSINA